MAMQRRSPRATEPGMAGAAAFPAAASKPRFEDFRERYRNLLAMALAHRRIFVIGFLAVVLASSFVLVPFLGSNFFPNVDAGEITLHVRPPVGTRIEDASAMFGDIEQAIREVIPPRRNRLDRRQHRSAHQLDQHDLQQFRPDRISGRRHLCQPQRPIIMRRPAMSATLRERLPREFPGATFSFLPADIVSQILNFGTPAPIDVQITGPHRQRRTRPIALNLLRRMRTIRGIADPRMQQSLDNPQLHVDVDRSRMAQLGLNELDVTNALGNVARRQLADGADVLARSQDRRVLSDRGADAGISGGFAVRSGKRADYRAARSGRRCWAVSARSRARRRAPSSRTTTSCPRSISMRRRRIATWAASRAISAVSSGDTSKNLPRGVTITLRGQVITMNTAFSGLTFGLLGAIVLVYLLIVVNFQSWLDPFIIITALPGALAGIVWMLFITDTTLSVPALTGAIMCMGVATANSILVVSFARERLDETGNAIASRDRGRHDAPSPGPDDGARHDHRHGADGAGSGRRRRAERAARPRRHRRAARRDLRHASFRARRVQHHPRPAGEAQIA